MKKLTTKLLALFLSLVVIQGLALPSLCVSAADEDEQIISIGETKSLFISNSEKSISDYYFLKVSVENDGCYSFWLADSEYCLVLYNADKTDCIEEDSSMLYGEYTNTTYSLSANEVYYLCSVVPFDSYGVQIDVSLTSCAAHDFVGETISSDGCTKEIKYTCKNCSVYYYSVVGEHQYSREILTHAPCGEYGGEAKYVCTVCGDTYMSEYFGQHQYDDGEITVQPSCTQNGVKTYTCSLCGSTYTKKLPKSHLDEDNDGNCDICGEQIMKTIYADTSLTIDVFEDEVSYLRFIPQVTGEYRFSAESWSDTYGYIFDSERNELCSNDDSEDSLDFSVSCEMTAGQVYYLGARFFDETESGSFSVSLDSVTTTCIHAHTNEYEKTDATCSECGYTSGVYCEDCGEWLEGHDEIEPHHTDDDNDGVCDNCSERLTRTIHSGETLAVDISDGSSARFSFIPEVSGKYRFFSDSEHPVCAWAYDEKSCICQDNMGGNKVNFSIECEMIAGEAYVLYAWMLYDGYQTGLFNVTLEFVRPFCSHTNVSQYAATQPNCTENGYTAGTCCDDCGEWQSGHEVIWSHHVDENNDRICDICGQDSVYESGSCGEKATYKLYNDGALFVTGSGKLSELKLVKAGNTFITSVHIDNGITEIDDFTFYYCINLESVDLPESLEVISSCAFENCCNLTGLYIPDSVKLIDSHAFDNCNNLSQVRLSNGLKTIGYTSFAGCSKLSEITIPDGTVTIDEGAFAGTRITDVELPSSVEYVGWAAFTASKTVRILNPGCVIEDEAFNGLQTVYGYDGSTAQEYADKYNIDFVSLGKNEIVGITLIKTPEITHYLTGSEKLDWHDIAYVVSFEDGSKVTRNNGYELSGFDSSKAGKCTITVSYKDKSDTFDIDIIDGSSTPILPLDIELGMKTLFQTELFFKFVPRTTDHYEFEISSSEYPVICLYDEHDDIISKGHWYYSGSSGDSLYGIGTSIDAVLEAGKTYYFSAMSRDTDGISVVSLSRGHSSSGEYSIKQPTCTEDGYRSEVCEYCGEEYVTRVLPATGHDYGDWTVRTASTCVEKGLEYKACSICGYEITREIEINADNHSYVLKNNEISTDGMVYWVYVCNGCKKTNKASSGIDIFDAMQALNNAELIIADESYSAAERNKVQAEYDSFLKFLSAYVTFDSNGEMTECHFPDDKKVVEQYDKLLTSFDKTITDAYETCTEDTVTDKMHMVMDMLFKLLSLLAEFIRIVTAN